MSDRLECAGVIWVKMWSLVVVPSGIHCSALIAPIILWDRMNLWCWTALRGRKHRQQAKNARKDKCKHIRWDWWSTQSKMTSNQHLARGSCGKNKLTWFENIFFMIQYYKLVYSKRRLPKFTVYARNTMQKTVTFTYIQIKNIRVICLPSQRQCPQLFYNQFALQPRWPVGLIARALFSPRRSLH